MIFFFLFISCKKEDSFLETMNIGDKPIILAEGSLSNSTMQWNNILIANSNNIYFTRSLSTGSIIQKMTWNESIFDDLKTIPLPKNAMHSDVFVDQKEELLIFSSTMLEHANDTVSDWNIWKCKKKNGKWQIPELVFQNHIEGDQFYPILTQNGNLFFSSRPTHSENADLYYSVHKDNQFSRPIPLPQHINSPNLEGDAFISPDESYLIYAGFGLKDGLGKSDLYICFMRNGKWTSPVWLGNDINSSGFDGSPFVTEDNKYLLFTSSRDSKNDSVFFNHYVVKFNPKKFEPNE